MSPAIRVVRILQFAFIVSVLLFYYIARTLHPPAQSVNAVAQWAIVVCAVFVALSGFIVQRVILNAPVRPASDAQNSTPQGRWFTGHVVRFATAESVALVGLVLRALGSPSNLVIAMFAGSLLLLLIWQPGDAPAVNESKNPRG